MVGVEQLNLEDAAAWLPPYPDDEDAAKLGRAFAVATVLPRPTPGTNEDRRFRRSVALLRDHGWPIKARGDRFYELSFARADIESLANDLRSRGRTLLRSSVRVRRIADRRAA